MKWEELREEEFEAAIEKSGGLCVVPLGCLEVHGQHLPVGTDSLKAHKLAELAAERTGAVVFPAGMWLGDVCASHSNINPKKHGYIGINPRTLMTVLEELCDEIARNGFRKILLLPSHGGNDAWLEFFIRGIYYKPRNYAVLKAKVDLSAIAPDKVYETVKAARETDFPYITDEDMAVLEKFAVTGSGGGHGDFRETGLIYGLFPHLVAPERFDAVSGSSVHRADYLSQAGISFGPGWPSNFPNAFSGYPPIGCTESIGKAMVKMSVDRLCGIFELLQKDEDCVRMARKLPPA